MINKINSAIILSAGIGERQKPLTNYLPKPLFPIANHPALDGIIDRLRLFGITEFFFNTYHLSEMVIEYLKDKTDIRKTLVKEEVLRNTGGGIANFREPLRDETFIVHNGDVYSEQVLSDFVEFHFRHAAIVTMMVVDYAAINTVRVVEGFVNDLNDKAGNRTYTGVAVFSPGIWKYMPDEEVFSIIPVLEKAIKHGEKIAAYDSKAYWCDIGTAIRYWELHQYLSSGGSGAIGESAKIENSSLKGFNYIGEEAFIRNSELRNCIVFPGSIIEGLKIKNMICHPFCQVKAK